MTFTPPKPVFLITMTPPVSSARHSPRQDSSLFRTSLRNTKNNLIISIHSFYTSKVWICHWCKAWIRDIFTFRDYTSTKWYRMEMLSTTFKNTFHTFILQFPVHSVPFKLQTVLTEELKLTSHKSNSSPSSITRCHVSMSMLKTQCCTYSAPELLLPPVHRAKHNAVPTRHLFVRQCLEITCSFHRDNLKCLQLSTALHHYNITDLKMEYSICHHSELGIIQSSPINLFLAIRISLVWYFRRSYWTS